MNYFRALIGKNKKRFIDRKYNLDLSYITPRILVMSYPTSFPQSLFHNSINEISNFLNERHGNNYLLINLVNENEDYDNSKFKGEVINYKIIDYMPPSLLTIFGVCNKIDDYLNENISNVVIINCKGAKGKVGKVGIIVCCYLLYIKKFQEINEAFNYYSFKRLYKGEGVTQPCEKRYVEYFHNILKSKEKFFPFRIQILSIELINMYEVYNNGYYVIEIMDNSNMQMKEFQCVQKNYKIDDENKRVVLKAKNLFNKEQYGDVVIKFSYNETFFNKKLGKISFNTAFLNSDEDELIFKAEDIDPDILLRNKIVPKNYLIKLNIKVLCEICPFKKKQDYCQNCKQFIKENKVLYEKWEKIMNNWQKYKDKKIKYDKNILFGNIDSDDCEDILAKVKERNKSDKNLTKDENKNEKNENDDKKYYEDNNDSNSLEESEIEDYEDKYDNNTEMKQKDKLNDSFESECFIF